MVELGMMTTGPRSRVAIELACLLCVLMWASEVLAAGPYQATGIKIGEVDQDSAIVWTRLTQNPTLKLDGTPFIEAGQHVVPASKQLPEGKTLADMEGAVPGKAGHVRFSWRKNGKVCWFPPINASWARAMAEGSC